MPLTSERSILECGDFTERVYDEKRLSKPKKYVQQIGVLNYKNQIVSSPRDNVCSRNYETTEDDNQIENTSVIRTHRVKVAKYSKIQYTGPTCQKLTKNSKLFNLIYLDGSEIRMTNNIDDVADLQKYSKLMFVNGEFYFHCCQSQEDYL